MKGYWHIAALSAVFAVLTIHFNNYGFIVFYIFWLGYLLRDNRLGKLPALVSLTLLLFFLLYIPKVDPIHSQALEKEAESIYGKIISPVSKTDKKIEFTFQEKGSGDKLFILHFPDQYKLMPDIQQLKYGAKCVVEGKRELPVQSTNPGQFDFRKYAMKQGISSQVFVDSLEDIRCQGDSLLDRLFQVRFNLVAKVNDKVSPFTASWLNSLVLGDDSSLDEDTKRLFQNWGLTHIIAISGTHIALLLAFIYFFTVKLSILTKEKAQWFVILILPVYAVLAGGEPSVWRASMMAVLIIMLHKLRLNYSVMDVLSLVFILLILWSPSIIYHIGFQFSFLVTFGIILSRKWLSTSNSSIMQALQISFLAQMVIIPLQFSYFFQFQPLSILLNILIIPYFTLIVIPFMYILLPLTFFPQPLTDFLDDVFVFIHETVLLFIGWVDSIADLPLVIGSFPLGVAILYYVFLILLMKEMQFQKGYKAFQYGLSICILILMIGIRPYLSPVGTVTMLDIGQGDAYIIELPYRQGVIMIDAGATVSFSDGIVSNNVYEQIIRPYLYSKGIQQIDALFLTHEDVDHMGSVSFIIKEVDVETIYIHRYYEPSEEEEQLWNQYHVDMERIGNGETVSIKNQSFLVMGPTKPADTPNDNSIILFTEIGGLNWLFTGDIGKDIEKDTINRFPNLDVDVLKVAHHGSNTSTDESFIRTISPEVALISVGKSNRYGHPNMEVIERLEEQGATILRTDYHGAVQFRFKKNTGTFFTFLP
ncbi:DNA internalization-related competence protein ComEC/Rec2 [Oceanobacillus salinisoli]|uniref:DNA internalization-related competence protein ComEC/Rec2 n=1 Tax=Oceanobacillus salinisoli TaxID=2678611 RepID=UPI0012E2235E|nr:DNA internalization-related competence protein ComEC/Rec2 [Oceanobacillus salinisoli]